jgi:multicomponent Na+:H+ antiporter subunit A
MTSEISSDFSMLLVALAPFIAALAAPWVKKFTPQYAGWVLAIVPASIFLFLLSFVGLIADGGKLTFALPWAPMGSYLLQGTGIEFSFYLDGLSLVFGLLISGIGTFIVIYAGGYLNGHPQLGRFFSFILMFMGSMLGLVMASNIITLFVFWELTSITSFLLIGFDHSRQASRRAAIQALVVTGGGGLALLAGLVLLANVMQTWNVHEMLTAGVNLGETSIYLPIFVLILLGAITKSAQVPFHFWLPNAMEAPTPVSAYLHSATMVKAGVYLLARMHPILGGTEAWFITLVVLGGVTLLVGALLALRQTDMKQMLAYTTMASLGMLVMLLGVGNKVSILAAMLFLVAHSFYKGGLFMVVGSIDHETGTRDITEVSGIWRKLPITFFGAALAAISMAGLPISLGFYAKEEIYLLAKDSYYFTDWLIVAVAILGNALMMAAGAAIAIKPFLGARLATPKAPHEAPLSMIAGPAILAVLGIGSGIFIYQFGGWFFSPSASAVYNHEVKNELGQHFYWLPFGLSVLTWLLGALFVWKLEVVRGFMLKVAQVWRWGPDQGFDQFMFGLVRFSSWITRIIQHGRLELYLITVFVLLAVAIYVPMLAFGTLPQMPTIPRLHPYEWGIFLIAVVGLAAVVLGKTRLVAIVSLGIQGFAVALIFLLFGAPDLGFTQFMVETLSVVILALVMTRLHLDQRDNRIFEEMIRDGGLALICGIGITTLLIAVLSTDLDMTLTNLFIDTSVPIAHGRNIVNVILVDYRAIDTLGEIGVVMTAGIAILALIRIRVGGAKLGVGALKPKTRRKRATPRKREGGAA